MADLSYLDAVILGVVEGLTEYLPVSSTGHLTITEKLLGLEVNDPAVTAYTAVIQLGAIAATLLYFFRDIVRFAVAWFRGLGSAAARKDPDYGLAWAVVIGSIPVGIVGFLARDLISGPLRSLWVVAVALLLWSVAMVVAERIYAGYEARGIDRVTATRLSFFLAIPALTAAGLFQAVQERHGLSALGVGPVLVGVVVAFVVAYATIAWLLRFVANHTLLPFVWYRVALGLVLAGVLAAGVISAPRRLPTHAR